MTTTHLGANSFIGGEGGIIRCLRQLTRQAGRSLATLAPRSLRRFAPPSRTEGFLNREPRSANKNSPEEGPFLLAEREGFEPSKGF